MATATIADNRPTMVTQRQAVVGAGNFARQISPPVQRRLASAAAPGGRGQVAQLRKIGRAISSEIEVQLSYLMDEVFSDTDPEYDEASTLFFRIDEDSQDTNVKRWLENASVATGNACFSNIATLVIEGGVRTNFYPSGYVSHARQAHSAYDAAHTHGNMVRCPGYNIAAHYATATTIDHIVPVSYHWNNVGYQTDKATRHQWYNDPTNHIYLCQSCNSSKGGFRYVKAPDYANGFSH